MPRREWWDVAVPAARVGDAAELAEEATEGLTDLAAPVRAGRVREFLRSQTMGPPVGVPLRADTAPAQAPTAETAGSGRAPARRSDGRIFLPDATG